MNTSKQLLIAVYVLIAISIATVSPAQAGFMDWFKSIGAKSDQAQNGSFDSLYASVLAEQPEAAAESPALLANAIAPVNAPSGYTTTTLRRTMTVQVSGYNSEVGQTDDSPFITANGTHVRDGIVAANIIDAAGRNIPFNTAIKFKQCGGIPEDKIFTVTDRLNKRYTKNVDIWFEHKTDALQFGRRTCQIEIIQ